MKKEKKKSWVKEAMSSLQNQAGRNFSAIIDIQRDMDRAKLKAIGLQNKVADNHKELTAGQVILFIMVVVALIIGIVGLGRTFRHDKVRTNKGIVAAVQDALDGNDLKMNLNRYNFGWSPRSYMDSSCLKDYIAENREKVDNAVSKEDFNRLMAYLDLEIVDVPEEVHEAKREVRLVEPVQTGRSLYFSFGDIGVTSVSADLTT